MPNGDHVFLFSQIEPLVCTTWEKERNRFISNLEMHLGEYSFLKEEVIKILDNFKYITELPKGLILTHIRKEISHKLKKKGKKRREIKKIRNNLFNILILNEYIVEIFPPHMSIREAFTIGY